ncbi:MAG: Dabb family protein [Pirellulaceae bacterium]|nr:Dabb family protein [Pirellulaceae bacterium]
MARLAHHVFFTLHDNSPAKVAELIAACQKYLTNHPGLESIDVGTLTPDLVRPVNDRAYDVSLHTVFADRAAHDAYQVAPRHNQFIDEQKPNWKQVRVFDSDLA